MVWIEWRHRLLGAFWEREREREVLENGRAAGIAVKGPVARTQAILFTEGWLAMRSNVSRTRRRKGASVYTPGSEECHRRKYATGSSYRPGSPIQRPWETVHRFRSSTLTFYFSRGGRLPAIVIWTRTPLNLTGQSAKETQIEEGKREEGTGSICIDGRRRI